VKSTAGIAASSGRRLRNCGGDGVPVWWVVVEEGRELGSWARKCREKRKKVANFKEKKKKKLQTFVTDYDGSVTNYDNVLICDGFSVTNFKCSVTNIHLLTCTCHFVTN